VFRNPLGTLLDVWEFERGAEVESVNVHGWLCEQPARHHARPHAGKREGVIRSADPHDSCRSCRARSSFPRSHDWHARNAPPVSICFRPKHRRTPRVRAVVEFATEIFVRMAAEREGGKENPATRPAWYDKRYGRASRARRG
jgi:hypothetical protein